MSTRAPMRHCAFDERVSIVHHQRNAHTRAAQRLGFFASAAFRRSEFIA